MRRKTFWISWIFAILFVALAGGACAGTAAQGEASRQPRRLTLQGMRGAEIVVLRGSPSLESSQLTFTGAHWDFFPDGTFRFTPGAAADVRSDLYPLAGVYRSVGDHWELHATRRNELGASLTLAGFVSGSSEAPTIQAVASTVSVVALKIIGIRQTLRPAAEEAPSTAWPPVPARFAVTFQGMLGGEPFGPLSGEVTLLPPAEGDVNPLSLSLATQDQDRQGSLSWTSFLAAAEPRVPFNAVTVDVEKREVVAQLLPGVKHPLAPTWVRLSPPPEMPELGAMADWIQADTGTIRLQVEGKRLEGRVSASGHGRSLVPVPYEARIEGVLQEAPPAVQTEGAENPYRGESLFSGTWSSDQLGSFQLRQTGTDVRGVIGEKRTEISGLAEGNVLFVRSNEEKPGLLVAVSDRYHLVAMLPEAGGGRWRTTVAVRQDGDSAPRVPAAAHREDLRDHGYALVLEGRCREAVGVLEQALDMYRQDRGNVEVSTLMQDGSLIDEINISTRLSACYVQLRRFEDLLASLREHVRIRRLLTEKGYLRQGAGDPEALAHLSEAMETYRRRLAADVSKIQVQDAGLVFFEELVDLLLDLDQPKEALVAAEKGRARAFVDLLAAGRPARPSSDERTIVSAGLASPVTLEGLVETSRRLQSTFVEYMVTDQRLIV